MVDLSLIVPIYNAESTIERLIYSLENQNTNLNYEIILVNDGSTDRTADILEKCTDKKIHIFKHENKGVSYSRNIGISKASGEFIMFIDSDDLIDLECLSILEKFLTFDMILFGFSHMDRKFVWSYSESVQSSIKLLNNRDYLYHLSTPYGKIFRTSIIKEANLIFDEDIQYGEDALFVYSYLEKVKTVKLISNILYFIDNSNNNSLSRKPQHNTINAMKKNFELILKSNKINDEMKSLLFFKWQRLVLINEIRLEKSYKELNDILNTMHSLYSDRKRIRLSNIESGIALLFKYRFFRSIVLIMKLRHFQLKRKGIL